MVTAAFTRISATPTLATTLEFDVIFTDDVVNVDPADFVVVTTGSASADALVGVSNGGDADDSTYVVTVTNVSPHGTIGLDFTGGTDITSNASTPIAELFRRQERAQALHSAK